MPVNATPELDQAGIDPAALQRLADACGPLTVIDVGRRSTIAEAWPDVADDQLGLDEAETA